MVYKFTYIRIQDSSTVKFFKIFHIYTQSWVKPGSIVLGVVRREMYNKRLFKKQKLFALVMTMKKNVFRVSGSYYCRFNKTSGMLLKDDRQSFIALKLFCPVSLELRQSAHKDLCQFSRRTF